VAIALVVVIVIAAGACAALARALGEQKRGREAADATARDQGRRLAAAEAERDELREAREWFASANAREAAEAERQRERAEAAEARLGEAAAGSGDAADGLWQLLLAHIARRWAAMVGVPPEGRGVVAGPAADQLAQALARETERLREEVGVDVDLVAPEGAVDPAAARLGDHPADRIPALLAAIELLGVLAASAQLVTVEVGPELVLMGDGWDDPAGELAAARDRAAAAGATIGPVVVDGERVEVVIRPRTEVAAG
jgi:hypothetical protein